MRSALLVLILAGSTAYADPAGDASKAFTAFVDGVAAGKPAAGLELFITPFRDDTVVPADLGRVRQLLVKPKVKVTKLVVSRAGKSAWLVGEVTARVPHGEKLKAEALRASALLVLDGDTWRVRASQWSAAVPNHPTDRCGNADSEWRFESSVPKELAGPVQAVIHGFGEMPGNDVMPGGDRAPFLELLSDDPAAVVIGSAASERFVGGAAIKRLFKKWYITHRTDESDGKPPARAGVGPDGELIWMYVSTFTHPQCVEYRTFVVLAKEASGWKIVHQHYSEPI